MQDTIQNEKRREPRFPIDATVSVFNKENGLTCEGVCCDVSASGLKVISKDPLPENTELHLAIDDCSVIFNGIGQVAHTAKTDEGYIIGLDVNFEPELPGGNSETH